MNKLSVVISAFNEEKKIKDCIQSVSFADEVILIDNNSQDKTAEIAKLLGAKIFKTPNNLMLNVNKNLGFSKAGNEWILNIDADERVSNELKEEIKSILETVPEDVSAFAIPRKNMIFGKWVEHTGWYPDYQVRLFRKNKGKFSEKHVHEQLSVEGRTQKLTKDLIHESYTSIREFLTKFFVIYAPNEADNISGTEGYSFHPGQFISKPTSEFVSRFYVQKGYKDGVHGLVLSLLMAFYHFVVVCYIWEKKKFINTSTDSRALVESEMHNTRTHVNYWRLSAKMNESKNPFIKVLARFQRRLLG